MLSPLGLSYFILLYRATETGGGKALDLRKKEIRIVMLTSNTEEAGRELL